MNSDTDTSALRAANVVQFLRKPHGNLHSVERTFSDVRVALAASGHSVNVRINRFVSRGLWPRLYDAVAARFARGQVNHVTGDVHYLCWFLPANSTVLTVLDCVGLHRLRGWRRTLFKILWYRIPARRSRFVTVISEFTRRDLISQIGISEDRVITIPLMVSDEFKPVPRVFDARCPRILVFATGPTKNIERTVDALRGLSCELVVVGFMSDSQKNALVATGLSFRNETSLDREAMRRTYEDVDLVLLASTFEGFGLPIVEAQAVGRPVVTSTVCSMPEVAGEGACLVDPFDVASIRAGVLRVIEDQEYRSSLIDRGFENVRRFSRETIAQQYQDLYSRVAREQDPE